MYLYKFMLPYFNVHDLFFLFFYFFVTYVEQFVVISFGVDKVLYFDESASDEYYHAHVAVVKCIMVFSSLAIT